MFETDLRNDPRYHQFDSLQKLTGKIEHYVDELRSASRGRKLVRVLVTAGELEGEHSSLRPELVLILDLSCPPPRESDAPSSELEGEAPGSPPGGSARTVKVERWVGMRVMIARERAGLSQEQLARQLGVPTEQVRRFEAGQERVGPGRLFAIAKLLRQPTTFFFAGFAEHERNQERFDRAILRLVVSAGEIRSEEALERFAETAEEAARSLAGLPPASGKLPKNGDSEP